MNAVYLDTCRTSLFANGTFGAYCNWIENIETKLETLVVERVQQT